MGKKCYVIIILIFLSVLLGGCDSKEITGIPDVTGRFDFTILKAGQADAILMQTDNHSIILDCGEKDDGDEMVKLLKEKDIFEVDYIFITHFDKDHVGGFPEIIENVTAKNIIVPDYEGSGDEYEKYLDTVTEKSLSITKLTENITFTLEDVLFEVSIPERKYYAEGENDFSLVISASHGENTFLFTGDAESERLAEVLSVFGGEYDFLKVPHHGKHNKNTKRFVNTVKPRYAVVTDSEKNPASGKTMSYLATVGTRIYSTKNGNVSVESDGKTLFINQQ